MTLNFFGFLAVVKIAYIFVRNFIKLSVAVHELSCKQSKNSDDAENNTAVATADSKNCFFSTSGSPDIRHFYA